jgi:integrating conjugative element protein (TIGR03765 family)
MNSSGTRLLVVLINLTALPGFAADLPLIVVQDLGGDSALPYYRALNLQDTRSDQTLARPPSSVPAAPKARYREADLLPVRSARLSPGVVTQRVIAAPGLTPLFLIGDDAHSRAWLRQRIDTLRALNAIGLVVNVDSEAALNALRRLAPDLTLVPASGDDLAQRLQLQRYPVLITATGIEQ